MNPSNSHLPLRRPILKNNPQIQCGPMGSYFIHSQLSANVSLLFLENLNAMIPIDRMTLFKLKTLQCQEMLNIGNLLYNPFIQHFQINENAVKLFDIEDRWHTTDNDVALLPIKKQKHKLYDDVNLDFFAIQREAQLYNDCSDLYKRLDNYFKHFLLQIILTYIKDSWCDLSDEQRTILYRASRDNKSLTVFDELSWFGYDCLLKAKFKGLEKVEEYKMIIRDYKKPDGRPQHSAQSYNALVSDFAANSALGRSVIAACDKHFEYCRRSRMPYTKMLGINKLTSKNKL